MGGALVISTLLVLGLALMLYPTAAQWFSSWEHRDLVDDYSEQMEAGPSQEHSAALEQARQYNQLLNAGTSVTDPFTTTAEESGSTEGPYWDMLAGGPADVMARLRIPTIDADLPVYHGISDPVLQKGIGHLEETALPVGGDGTHSVLTGHSGLPQSELFTQLEEVELGDTFFIDVFGETLAYEITETQVVEPHETESLRPQAGRDLVTLITCTPIGINSHRVLVTAERTDYSPDDSVTETSSVAFPWWAVILGAALVAQLSYLYKVKKSGPPRKSVKAGSQAPVNRR